MRNKSNKWGMTTRRHASCATLLLLTACAAAPPDAPPKIDRISAAALEARIPAPLATISIDDIVTMTQHGESPENIIGKIDATHSHYRLDAAQIATLLDRGVAHRVLDHILDGERRRIFDDVAADAARRDQACLEHVEREVRQCRLQAQPALSNCWPPHPGFPYWRCY